MTAAQDRLLWPTVRCFNCNNLYEIPIAPPSSEFVRPGSIVATPKCSECESTAYSNLAEDQTAATTEFPLYMLVGRPGSLMTTEVDPAAMYRLACRECGEAFEEGETPVPSRSIRGNPLVHEECA